MGNTKGYKSDKGDKSNKGGKSFDSYFIIMKMNRTRICAGWEDLRGFKNKKVW